YIRRLAPTMDSDYDDRVGLACFGRVSGVALLQPNLGRHYRYFLDIDGNGPYGCGNSFLTLVDSTHPATVPDAACGDAERSFSRSHRRVHYVCRCDDHERNGRRWWILLARNPVQERSQRCIYQTA